MTHLVGVSVRRRTRPFEGLEYRLFNVPQKATARVGRGKCDGGACYRLRAQHHHVVLKGRRRTDHLLPAGNDPNFSTLAGHRQMPRGAGLDTAAPDLARVLLCTSAPLRAGSGLGSVQNR